MSRTPEVLFVCVHNAGRSQMAAALLQHHAQGKVAVRSAGSAPAETLNPAVLAVMGELGLDLSAEFPKKLTTDAVEAADVVITMGCGDCRAPEDPLEAAARSIPAWRRPRSCPVRY
ncbi:hypothetical protein [Saccharopolyspora hattusasensis]|uniref:arsenate reductase/protein-tyrosine-phosphatase family protein n=1 Tax=Saccharopolyspora hattusasensis TaxID=1128679 RepID=UPI003D994A9A